MMTYGRIHSRLFGLAALLVVLTMLAGIAPRGALAALDDGVFESEDFGFRIEWDTDVWTGQEADVPEGTVAVTFESVTSWGQIQAYSQEFDDDEGCLAQLIEPFAEDDGDVIEDFGVAPVRMDRFESLRGSESELYTYIFPGSNGHALDLVMFASCAPIQDGQAMLEIYLTTSTDVYEDVAVEWEDLVAGITVDEPASSTKSRDRRGDDEPSLDRGEYRNPVLGFSVNWDETAWTATEVDDDPDTQGVELESDRAYAAIISAASTEFDSPEACLDKLIALNKESDEVERLRKAPKRIERPDVAAGAAGEVVTYTETENGTAMIGYLECRMLDEGVLTVQYYVAADDYEDELPALQELLDAIKVGDDAGAGERNGGKDTDQASAGTLTTPNHGVRVEYDDTIWTPEDFSDHETDLVAFESEYGRAQVIAVAAEPDLEGCLDALVSDEERYAADGIDVASSRYDRPETDRGAEAELYTYEFESESGPIDVFVYFECRELGSGDGLLAVTFTTFGDAYEDALPVLEAFLAGVRG